jgi:hypothetical protein
MEIPQTSLAWRQFHDRELTAQSGANPYASGNKVEGVTYAAEVNAIEGNAGLMAGAIAKDNADLWVRSCRLLLTCGALWDDAPFTALLENVPTPFGPANPVKKYLRPDAAIIIREDTMMFQPRDQQIARAKDNLMTVAPLAQMFPQALGAAMEEYQRARGEKNISKYMAGPSPAPPMGAAGQMDPATPAIGG